MRHHKHHGHHHGCPHLRAARECIREHYAVDLSATCTAAVDRLTAFKQAAAASGQTFGDDDDDEFTMPRMLHGMGTSEQHREGWYRGVDGRGRGGGGTDEGREGGGYAL